MSDWFSWNEIVIKNNKIQILKLKTKMKKYEEKDGKEIILMILIKKYVLMFIILVMVGLV